MRNTCFKVLVSFLFFIVTTVNVLGFSISYRVYYLPIDSLSEEYVYSNIVLDLRNKSLAVLIEDTSLSFIQEYNIDSIYSLPGRWLTSLIAYPNEKTIIRLNIKNLLSINEDSVWVNATFMEFDAEKGTNTSKMKTLKSFPISKKDLAGVLLAGSHEYGPVIRPPYKKYSFIGGYSINPEEDHQTSHMLEIGISRVKDMGGMMPEGYTYYIANEFVFNPKKFSIGPKIGCNMYAGMFVLGSELVYYTDFRENTLHWVPFFGFGGVGGRIYVAGHVPFYNKNYPYVHPFSIGLNLSLFRLSNKKFL